MAGHLGLGKLVVFYDDNKITIDGSTDLSFTEDVEKRFQAYGWRVLTIENGDDEDPGKFAKVIDMVKGMYLGNDKDKPTLVKMRTTIGFGCSKEGSEK